jgi:hypothetical protein
MQRPLAAYLRLTILALLLALNCSAWAQPLRVDALPAGHLGLYSQVLQETQGPLTVEQAAALFLKTRASQGKVQF